MDIVDVSDWVAIRGEEMGRDARKVWIAQRPGVDRGDWWLWKPCLTTGKDGWARRLNDVAEALTFRLARTIGLPTAHCELAANQGMPGVISRNVSPHPMDLVHGSAMLQPGAPYGLVAIRSALCSVTGPTPCHMMSGFQVFAGYLVLDAWIANTDRHGENWGLLQAPDGRLSLAPAFDHGSALGSGLTDHNREARDVRAFCTAGRTRHFEEGGTLLDLAAQAVELSGAQEWPRRVAAVSPALWRGILGDIEGLSVTARTFIDEVLTENQERVSTLCQR